MEREELERIISEKITQNELKNSESRLRFALIFGGAFLTVFGVIIPIIITGTSADRSTERVDNSIELMERRFEELVGKQLRKPIIECLYENRKLEGQLVDFSDHHNTAISGIIIQNKGDGIAWTMGINLYLKFEKHPKEYRPKEFRINLWKALDHIDESGFDVAFEYQHSINNVYPQKSFSLPIGHWTRIETDQKVKALLKIYYGEPEPLRINWDINLK